MTHTPDEIAAMIERLERKTAIATEWNERIVVPDRLAATAAAMLRDVAAERDALLSRGGLSENGGFNELYEETVQLPFGAGTAQGKAEAGRDRLAAMVEKMRGYAVHDDDCDALFRCNSKCTCGLSDVLKESENG